MSLQKLLPLTLILLTGCIFQDPFYDDGPFYSAVYVPVYASEEQAHQLSIKPSFEIRNPAKIWTYNDLLMVNIENEGIHVIDNSNPYAPEQLFFISIPGNKDVAIKDGFIYADNYGDIVVFTLTDTYEIEVRERLKGVMQNQEYPPFEGVAFECVDPSRGVVIDWVQPVIDVDPKCFR
jgi:hypothetical protein